MGDLDRYQFDELYTGFNGAYFNGYAVFLTFAAVNVLYIVYTLGTLNAGVPERLMWGRYAEVLQRWWTINFANAHEARVLSQLAADLHTSMNFGQRGPEWALLGVGAPGFHVLRGKGLPRYRDEDVKLQEIWEF